VGLPMTAFGPFGISVDVKPHAYDPSANPELFEGVLARRVVAFTIDMIVIAIPLVLAWIFIFVFGLLTFGLGWMLFWMLSPASVVWALAYYGMTLGSEGSATLGMRAMDLQMRTWYGARAYFVLGAVHAVVFWLSVTMLTPVSCWSACSTAAGGFCTISWSALSSSTNGASCRAPRRRAVSEVA
jgi:uncharacterized RDD family membrane protein YckC